MARPNADCVVARIERYAKCGTAFPLGKVDSDFASLNLATRRNHSVFNADTLAEDAVASHPAVDQPAIVSDLVAITLDGFHNVEIFIATHSAKHDVADLKQSWIDRCNGAELPGFDSPFHRLTARAE
jgi:hypothetical protein